MSNQNNPVPEEVLEWIDSEIEALRKERNEYRELLEICLPKLQMGGFDKTAKRIDETLSKYTKQ